MAWTSIGKFEWPIAWALLTGVPSFASRWPEINEVNGLQAALDGKIGAVNPSLTGLAEISGLVDVGYQMSPTGGRSVRLAATNTPNTGLYDVTNGQWLLRIAGDNRVFTVGGEVLTTGNFNPATKLNNSGSLVPFTGSINFQGPAAAVYITDRSSSRQWALYGATDTLYFWNGSQNVLGVDSGGGFNRSNGRLIVGGSGTGATGASSFGTLYGYVDFGPQNATYCHFYTDRPAYYFNKPIEADGGFRHFGGPRVPRMFVQATDPGTAAQPGDIWVIRV